MNECRRDSLRYEHERAEPKNDDRDPKRKVEKRSDFFECFHTSSPQFIERANQSDL